jgi:Mitochondrial carrier protein
MVVTPMEVIKIRLQAQHHSMADPLDIPKYRNAAHALYTVVKEEGIGALYRGISLTALRQGRFAQEFAIPHHITTTNEFAPQVATRP